MITYTLKVLSVEIETSDTVTISFKQPALRKIKYLPGQYLTLIFRINGRRYLRPYSFSSTPEIDQVLNITVKRMNGGIVSNHIIDTVKANDLIEVLEPLGDFILPDNEQLINRNLILWGAGSGITPLFSIIKHVLNQEFSNHVTLVYGNRNRETTIFSKQIEALQQKYPDRFSVIFFYTNFLLQNSNPFIIQGRIAPEKILSTLKNENNLDKSLHYICGPAGMKLSIERTLQFAGVKGENIFSEDFEVKRNPEELEDIHTQNVSVIRDSKSISFEVTKGKSILEAGLDALLELDYSCQTGSCLLCKANLIKGKVKMLHADTTKLQNEECLLCCSFPLTNDVEVEIK